MFYLWCDLELVVLLFLIQQNILENVNPAWRNLFLLQIHVKLILETEIQGTDSGL